MKRAFLVYVWWYDLLVTAMVRFCVMFERGVNMRQMSLNFMNVAQKVGAIGS